jgi:hypothetical protein
MLSDGEGEYLLNLDCTAGSYDSVIGPTGTIVIRLAWTAHGYSVCAAPIQWAHSCASLFASEECNVFSAYPEDH